MMFSARPVGVERARQRRRTRWGLRFQREPGGDA